LLDPETRKIIRFEELLKNRIFLADRFEKVEKALHNMNLISKETTFCSDFEFTMFKEEIAKPEVIVELSNMIAND
jgi:hypothetical protein